MALSPELAAWRKAERARLIEARIGLGQDVRAGYGRLIDARLQAAFPQLGQATLGICWPYQGEYDARPVGQIFRSQGARLALPSVVAKAAPLVFLEWAPGVAMREGVYGIPVPAESCEVVPQVLIVPVVGVGSQGDRLGYGGGFYDRTLAAIVPRPITIAIAHEVLRVPTTYPQDHDILMDFVVTEAGVEASVPGGLERIDEAAAARRFGALWTRRGHEARHSVSSADSGT
jgi:5,10-methenyltetrahydrofolate synthetase